MFNFDALRNLFSGGGGSPVAPNGQELEEPWRQILQQQMDPDRQRMRAVVRGLADFGHTLATTPGNFGTGLAAGATAGARGVADAMDASSEQNQKLANQMLDRYTQDQRFKRQEQRDTAQDERWQRQFDADQNYRNSMLDLQQRREEAGNQRQDMMDQRWEREFKADEDHRGATLDLARQKAQGGGGPGNAPSGYRWAQDGISLEGIPGGPADVMAGEIAGRAAALDTAMETLPEARNFFMSNEAAGPIQAVQSYFNAGDIGRAQRTVKLAIESGLRAMTGAAAPESEVENYMNMFGPQATDTLETRQQKLGMLESFMGNIKRNMTRGRAYANEGLGGASVGEPSVSSLAETPPAAAVSPSMARPQNKAEYDALPSGSQYMTPDGSIRRKP